VVLGSTSGQARAVRAAQLLERGFASNGLGWLRPALGTVDNLAPIDATPPNLRDEMCNGKRKRPATDEDEDATLASASAGESAVAFFATGLQAPMVKPSELLAAANVVSEPMIVYTGPKRTGPALIAAVAADDQKQTTRPRGKKSRVAAKPDADKPKTGDKTAARTEAKSDAKSDAKPAAKPATVRHANAKPDAAAVKPAAKPEAAAKPAAAKPAPKPAAAKPAAASAEKPAKPKAAAKPKSETKPAG